MTDSVTHRLAGSDVHFEEVDGELVLYLPAQRRRWVKHAVGTSLWVGAFLLLLLAMADAPLLAYVFLGTLLAVLLGAGFAGVAWAYFTKSMVLITPKSVVVKTALWGWEALAQYPLGQDSRARQWTAPPRPRRRSPKPSGITFNTIETEESEALFGDGLSQGELDWVQWRINRFLEQAADAPATLRCVNASLDGASKEPILRPSETQVRVEEKGFETRFCFPNSIETRTFDGVGSVLLGGGLLGCFAYALPRLSGAPDWRVRLVIFGLFAAVGLLLLLGGLTQLAGRRWLTISPEKIMYRAGLCGIGLRWTLPTDEVISVGSQEGRQGSWHRASPLCRSQAGIATTKGGVIRTAKRELSYWEAVPKRDRGWVFSDVARRVEAARLREM